MTLVNNTEYPRIFSPESSFPKYILNKQRWLKERGYYFSIPYIVAEEDYEKRRKMLLDNNSQFAEEHFGAILVDEMVIEFERALVSRAFYLTRFVTAIALAVNNTSIPKPKNPYEKLTNAKGIVDINAPAGVFPLSTSEWTQMKAAVKEDPSFVRVIEDKKFYPLCLSLLFESNNYHRYVPLGLKPYEKQVSQFFKVPSYR